MSNSSTLEYFRSIKYADVKKKLTFLNETLPKKPTKRNYQLPVSLLKSTDKGINASNLEEHLQKVANFMREHLLIDKQIKVLTMKNVNKEDELGNIDGLHCIRIKDDLEHQNYYQKVALVAKGISHYYLTFNNITLFHKAAENELLTEVTAIYTGLGFLLTKGLTESPRVGLNRRLIELGILKTARLRKQAPTWVLKNIIYYRKLLALIILMPSLINYYKAKIKKSFTKLGTDEKVIIVKPKQKPTLKISTNQQKEVFNILEFDELLPIKKKLLRAMEGDQDRFNRFQKLYRKKHPNLSEKDRLDKMLYDLKR